MTTQSSTSSDSLPAPIRGCMEACQQCRALVQALGKDQYAAPISDYSSIGAHMRHSIEHFICLFEGLEDAAIHYDGRRRDRDLEQDPMRLLHALDDIEANLGALPADSLEQPVEIYQTPARDYAPAPFKSTLGRELVFLASHAIHHLALMRVLARLAECEIDENVGLAYSTAAHRNQQAEDNE